MAGDPQRSKRKVMTGVMFSTSNCHSQRPHCFIRHFASYHGESYMSQIQSSVSSKLTCKVIEAYLPFQLPFYAFICNFIIFTVDEAGEFTDAHKHLLNTVVTLETPLEQIMLLRCWLDFDYAWLCKKSFNAVGVCTFLLSVSIILQCWQISWCFHHLLECWQLY